MPRYLPHARHVSPRRLLRGGLAVVAAIGLAGAVLELWHFGGSEAAAAARVESQVRRRFDQMTATLSRVADSVTRNPATADALTSGADGARMLFDVAAAGRAAGGESDDISLTIYSLNNEARAWAGRPSDNIPKERTGGPAAFFVIQGPLGLRLVHVRPLAGADGRRLGSIAVEHVLSPSTGPPTTVPADFMLPTPIAPVSLRMRWEAADQGSRPGAFVLHAPSGDALAEAVVNPADLRRARQESRRHLAAVVTAASGLLTLLLIGPLLDRRMRADKRAFVGLSLAASALLVGGTAILWAGCFIAVGQRPATPVPLLITAFGAAALVAIWASPAVRRRLVFKGRRRDPVSQPAQFVATQLAGGAAVVMLLVAFERVLNGVVNLNTVDIRHFSLHPWNATRIGVLAGVLALQTAALWAAALVLVAAPAAWRLSRALRGRLMMLVLWLLPTAAVAAAAAAQRRAMPTTALLLASALCGVAALLGTRIVASYRHTTVAARILALFVAFLIPSLLLYPSVDYFAERAIRHLIADRYAVEAQNHQQTVQNQMEEATHQIDALTTLADLVTDAPDLQLSRPRTESAFLVWNQTVLARGRVTSAIELYDRSGELISRFALNFPEYTGAAQAPQGESGCEWDKFGEAQPFGSEERRMLHAEKHICVTNSVTGQAEPVGTIVVHVPFDYRALPFITSQSPYYELFRSAESGAPREGMPGGNVDVAIYGWGLRPLYTSSGAAWPITDDLFARIYDSARTPFWARIARGDKTYDVYFSNDRVFIYAIGYPSLTLFDRLVHIAELTTLAGVAFIVVLVGTGVFTRISRERPRVGRALLREIRASFYRKLFLAFVLASVVPVLILALVIRAYFADLLGGDVQAEAARTAAVAQRVIEQSDALLRRSPNGLAPLSDNVMVWIRQVIDQDVNIFDGPTLYATSERDLFSSGLLPTRTPDDVYRAIVLEGLPSFVDEDRIGNFPYLIAASPVRAGERQAILTVPLVSRQREIEREIDDLDRGVRLAALFFILLGAAIGLSLAERIADPVRRLTRATRSIARGDFDARIAVKSADELKRLVDAFNSMAGELKAQSAQLERTHRLEAWAEMARQVAHEIKNPLTPIQLSAEHLRRVHADRGDPLGPVLDECVSSILNQVRLLRQISAEFSSFASSPTAKPAPVDVPPLVAEVVDPYRTGLRGRIHIENHVTGPLPRVHVDRTLITRALANIVENALHAMPGPGQLAIDASVNDGFVTLSIRDTGVGMDENALARIFEPYFSTKTTGTGLGLPIARRNIELNGGAIAVESRKGVGTVVTVMLPIAA